MASLRSCEQELPARLSTGAEPHRLLLLLQERRAASRTLTSRLTLVDFVVLTIWALVILL